MQIKTVVHNDPNVFDLQVNGALAEGYRLTRRDVVQVSDKQYRLYAELVKPDEPAEPQEPDLFACAEVIRQACKSVESCQNCPLENICGNDMPHRWAPVEGGAP